MKLFLCVLLFVFYSVTARAGMLSSSGKDDRCTADHSLAWCVMDYLGVSQGVVDTDVLRGNYRSMDPLGTAMNVVGAGLGIGEISGVVKPLPGINPRLSGAFLILLALGEPKGYAHERHILVLMPPELAQNDPLEAIIDTFGTAGMAVFEAKSFDVITTEHKPLLGPKSISRKLVFKGGRCAESQCMIESSLFSSGDYSGDRFESVGRVPAYLAKGPVVQWAKGNWSYFPRASINGNQTPQLSLQLAMQLPEWIYSHFGIGAGFPDPFVLGGGSVHWFLKPGASSN